MPGKNETWRETRLTLPANQVYAYQAIDTKPNYFLIVNNGAGTIYVSSNASVSESTYDIVVPAYGVRIYAKPLPPQVIYFYTITQTSIYLGHMEIEFDPSMIAQTQEITSSVATGVLGIVDVRNVLNPLPAGANKIGQVDISSLPSLPAGNNNIGKVDVLALPSLPVGNNNIGDVDVASLPALNVEGTALASAARTATTNSPDLANNFGKTILVIVNVTAITGEPSITIKVQGKDPASGAFYDLLSSASITAIGTYVLQVGAGLPETANQSANKPLPKTFRISVTHANADSITYSVGYSLQ